MSSSSLVRTAVSRIHPQNTALLICDMQEKFRSNIKYFAEITIVTRRLFDAAKILGMKVVATEQYPKGLGHTVSELPLKENNVNIYEKTRFSMCLPDLTKELPQQEIKSVVVCGIEAHVCVYHTTLDFLEKGYNVHLVVDGCSSRTITDRVFAYRQLEKAGAVLTTSECVLFSLLQDSTHPKFKEVQKLLINSAPDTGLASHF